MALGLTENDGVVGPRRGRRLFVMLATMGVMAAFFGVPPTAIMGIKSIETGVFGGILVGGIAAWLFNRYYKIQLPPYLGFFAGKRFVPIVTAFAAIVCGLALALVWPPWAARIDAFSHWAAVGEPGARRLHLRPRRAPAAAVRPASHLERAVLLRDRQLHQDHR